MNASPRGGTFTFTVASGIAAHVFGHSINLVIKKNSLEDAGYTYNY